MFSPKTKRTAHLLALVLTIFSFVSTAAQSNKESKTSISTKPFLECKAQAKSQTQSHTHSISENSKNDQPFT